MYEIEEEVHLFTSSEAASISAQSGVAIGTKGRKTGFYRKCNLFSREQYYRPTLSTTANSYQGQGGRVLPKHVGN